MRILVHIGYKLKLSFINACDCIRRSKMKNGLTKCLCGFEKLSNLREKCVLLRFLQQISLKLAEKLKLLYFVQLNLENQVFLSHKPKISCTKYNRIKFVLG